VLPLLIHAYCLTFRRFGKLMFARKIVEHSHQKKICNKLGRSRSKRMFCNKLPRLQNIQIEANILQKAWKITELSK
jgi:hypothetical protein